MSIDDFGQDTVFPSPWGAAPQTAHYLQRPNAPFADLVGGGNEAAFLWDQLLNGVLNGPARPRRTVSVEDGHMVALPDGFRPPPFPSKADTPAAAPSGDLDDSVADIARLDLTANGAAPVANSGAEDSPDASDKTGGEAATNGAPAGYVQVGAVPKSCRARC